jgi:MoaA/NifB/PqqE/SkfB family radical SAM enzyme
MKLPNDKFCILPWVSLETSPIGTVRPCCLAKDEIVDDTNAKFQLKTASFNQIRNSGYMQKLRSEFLEGQLPTTCERCWAVENSGGTSKRQHTINRLNHIVDDSTWTNEPKDLIFLDLKLGNICNLKCRICGPWSSSSYAAEEVGERMTLDRKQTYAYQMLREGRWPRESPDFWQELDAVADQIRYLEFTGGEPFMIAEHFDFLQTLVDCGLAHNIEIHYNTNGTQYPERGIALWPYFKTVEIAFSIDDLRERFEYQRSGAKWQDVETNLYKFRQLRLNSKNIQLQLCCTISIWNVVYFDEIAAWASLFPWDFVYWNYLHDSPVWCIANVIEGVKDQISLHLRDALVVQRFLPDLEKILDFMYSKEGWISCGRGGTLTYEIDRLDKLRGQSLKTSSPLLAKILHYNGPYND